MSLLQRLLLLPLLSPLLAVMLLGALNPRPWVALRVLTWTTAAWPLGAWIGGAAAAGAALSAAAAGLALQTEPAPLLGRRQVRSGRDEQGDDEPWTQTRPEPSEAAEARQSPWGNWAGPTRAAADPPPTVSVPFRVIRKGRGTAAAATGSSASAPSTPQSSPVSSSSGSGAARATSTATAVGDGWDTHANEDW